MKKHARNNGNSKTVKNMKLPFFENQGSGDMCRLHAINNALGRSVLSKKQFFAYCDEFDMHHHCKGSHEFFFVNSNDNIITFILNKFHVQSSYYPPTDPPNLKEDSDENIMAVITFDTDHIWCNKKHNGTWFRLDSLSDGPREIHFRSLFARRIFGWIVLWNNSKPISHDRSFESNLKVGQQHHQKMNSINQISASPSQQCSKHIYFEEQLSFEEPLLLDERNDSNNSNRFQILSDMEE